MGLLYIYLLFLKIGLHRPTHVSFHYLPRIIFFQVRKSFLSPASCPKKWRDDRQKVIFVTTLASDHSVTGIEIFIECSRPLCEFYIAPNNNINKALACVKN